MSWYSEQCNVSKNNFPDSLPNERDWQIHSLPVVSYLTGLRNTQITLRSHNANCKESYFSLNPLVLGIYSTTKSSLPAGKQVEETHKFGQKLILKISSCRLIITYNKTKVWGWGERLGGKLNPKLPNISTSQKGLNVFYSISAREELFRYSHIHKKNQQTNWETNFNELQWSALEENLPCKYDCMELWPLTMKRVNHSFYHSTLQM